MSDTTEDHVLAETLDGIRLITLNRPKRLNAWDAPMRARLLALLAEAAAAAEVQAVVLTGAGERAFCAGQDLNEGKTFDGDRAEGWIEEWRALYGAIRAFEKPLVCALNGLAAGSAFQVALLCDIRIGHAGSKMGQPEINSGIVSATGFWIIREMLGLSRAIEMVLTGRMAEAEECHRLGLLHHLVPAGEVLPTAMRVATELAAKPKLAFRLNKQRFREATQPGFDETFAAARALHRQAFSDGHSQQVMQRFLDRGRA
ncbi:enoyl-CoA hydratase/isomerase family protein [Falsiroseomonas selenitidurans]|uniref:Enoyl-CoA hydratase/isomerase family protein n=1 Tax=Falsiroseomonas selenitidurans TaxID=2716335 RepID=A0ABX1E292_9PROT|nr:enoyl-CoA hydratase/isomerase family protein [Falsiroseomonas selenitidurans]NKC29877.1 enoyl-CoA hydratase/isomerase family protein [Falsiroseomonas selenitidurans]